MRLFIINVSYIVKIKDGYNEIFKKKRGNILSSNYSSRFSFDLVENTSARMALHLLYRNLFIHAPFYDGKT